MGAYRAAVIMIDTRKLDVHLIAYYSCSGTAVWGELLSCLFGKVIFPIN